MDEGSLGARQCLDAIKPAYDTARAEGKAVGLEPRSQELGARQRIRRDQ